MLVITLIMQWDESDGCFSLQKIIVFNITDFFSGTLHYFSAREYENICSLRFLPYTKCMPCCTFHDRKKTEEEIRK